jgi:hypothetical protein
MIPGVVTGQREGRPGAALPGPGLDVKYQVHRDLGLLCGTSTVLGEGEEESLFPLGKL